MSFIPGSSIGDFKTKSGKSAIVRYPRWEDVTNVLEYINKISSENTFITFSGEQQTLEQEAKYIASQFGEMELDRSVISLCMVDDKLVGICNINQNKDKKTRGIHAATLGVSIDADFRGDAIGFNLMQMCIGEAKKKIAGLRIIQLDCFAINTPAIALYTKLGFKEWGRMPQGLLYKGEYVDEVHMALPLV